MILDTSAIVCILYREPEASTFADIIEAAHDISVSVGTVLEASLVLGPSRQQVLDSFLAEARAVVVPVDVTQLTTARSAHLTYGRGSGSPARLNFGDCFAYALAITASEPLLFKGEDFAHTDVLDARR